MTAATRIYKVVNKDTDMASMILAYNRAHALRYVAERMFQIEPIKQNELVAMLQQGEPVVDATKAEEVAEVDFEEQTPVMVPILGAVVATAQE